MSAAATAIATWVSQTPLIDGVLFGSADAEVEGPPVCAVAVAGALRGYGKGHTQSQALASAVGEALEQVAARRVEQRLLCSTFADLGSARAFDPRWLGLYSAEQYARAGFPFRRFDPHTKLHWVEGRWLDTGERVYLPAFAVYLSHQFASEALCQVTSNGLGAGHSLAAAVEQAVLELHERDAFLRSWMGLLPKRNIAVDEANGILAHLSERGARTEIYLLSDAPVPVVAAVAIGNGVDWPAFTLGLGAGRSVAAAAEKAILELGQTGPYLARLWRRAEVPLPKTREDVTTLQDHALYYCDLAHRAEFERWLQGPDGLAVLDAGYRIALADITPVELKDSPYRIVRALGCGLQAVWSGYGFERVASYAVKNEAPCPIC